MRNRWAAVGLLLAACLCVAAYIGSAEETTPPEVEAVEETEDYTVTRLADDGTALCEAHLFRGDREAVAKFRVTCGTLESGKPYIAEVESGGIRSENGWTAVDHVEIIEVVYRFEQQEADVVFLYDASVGSGYEAYNGIANIDLAAAEQL